MFRFIHAADVHLDSPLQGLEAHEGAPLELLRGARYTLLAGCAPCQPFSLYSQGKTDETQLLESALTAASRRGILIKRGEEIRKAH